MNYQNYINTKVKTDQGIFVLIYWDLSQNLVGDYDGVQINYVSEDLFNSGLWDDEDEIELVVDFITSINRGMASETELAIEESVYHANTYLLNKNLKGGYKYVA